MEHIKRDMKVPSGRMARLIAYYLPQFYPTPENDVWWGKGFTEWRNVAKAKPLYRGHYQPHIPADLGFYDLRVPEIRLAQAEMANQNGIEGFCYYHYWFAGRRLLERPFSEVLRSGEPNFPFCLCWANETWAGVWHGGSMDNILIEQTYPGPEDDERHFYVLLDAFADDRYIKIGGKPLFLIYAPEDLPNPKRTTDLWRELAHKAGLKGLYLVAVQHEPCVNADQGFDAVTLKNIARVLGFLRRPQVFRRRQFDKMLSIYKKTIHFPLLIYPYSNAITRCLAPGAEAPNVFPSAFANWDNTPRAGANGFVLHGSTPELFRKHLRQTIDQVRAKPYDSRIVFLKSWNEWAEGNYLEPDLRYGKGYLSVVREENSISENDAST